MIELENKIITSDKILRIIDKETNLFKRDDFTYDEEFEIGLDVVPSQGLLTTPMWENIKWIESGIEFTGELDD